MKRALSVILAAILTLSITGIVAFAATKSKSKAPTITSISGPRSIARDKTGRYRATVKEGKDDYAGYSDGDVYWESSNTNVIWIDEDTGQAEAYDYGECTIRAFIYAVDTDGNQMRSKAASYSITVRVPGGPKEAYPEYYDDERSSSSSSTSSSKSTSSSNSGEGQIATSTVTSAIRESGSSFTFKGYSSVSSDTITSAKTTAANLGKKVKLNFDTYADGRFDARMSVYPANASGMPGTINTGVSMHDDNVGRYRALFNKHFKNENMAFIKMSQNGSLGMTAEVAAKLNLSGFGNTKYLYAYNPATGKYDRINNATFLKDPNNFWHITTTSGGVLVITDAPLKK